MIFATDTSQPEQLIEHLKRCSDQFSSPIASRVDLVHYAFKLFEHADRFEAWDGSVLVGLVAAYMNPTNRECFITNVSVLPSHLRRGIGAKLLGACLRSAQERGLQAALLEVPGESVLVVHLYQRCGFVEVERRGNILVMRCPLEARPSRAAVPGDQDRKD
jgi:ribosomal protein S18 acetylase RimI-like enzyme